MIWVILLIGLVLRIVNLDQSLWLDEATQAILSSKSIYSIWFERAPDFHPPFSYILFHFWLVFGTSEIWLRLLSVFFGVGTILVTYKLVKKIINQKIALISAILLAVAPYHIYYSQEVRMYSMTTFFAVLSMFFFINLNEKLKSRIGFILSTATLIYTHYLGIFLILAQFFYLAWIRKNLNVFLQNLSLIFLIWLPWIPEFLHQLQSGVNANQYLPGWANLLSLSPLKAIPLTVLKFTIGRISFENNALYALVGILLVLVMSFLIILGFIHLKKDQKVIVFWLFVPIILAWLISFIVPLDQPFRLLFVIPAFYILIARGILTFGKF